MNRTRVFLSTAATICAVVLIAAQAHRPGFKDTPKLPNQKWLVHDADRPYPRAVTPGTESTPERPGRAPSDAVVLFDGRGLSQWVTVNHGKAGDPKWKVENGYFEIVPNSGDLVTKEKFGDAQIHVEWAAPSVIKDSDQMRGNSGVILMSRYEIQVLDSYNNPTYADGVAAAMYGQWPPLVSAVRKPGEWQTYDIAFEAPRFENGSVVKPAYVTVFHNGVLVHNHQAFIGRMAYRQVGTYAPHANEEPLLLQDHGTPVRYRNIWVRRLGTYDQQ